MDCRVDISQPISMRIKPGLYFGLPASISKSYLAVHTDSEGYD